MKYQGIPKWSRFYKENVETMENSNKIDEFSIAANDFESLAKYVSNGYKGDEIKLSYFLKKAIETAKTFGWKSFPSLEEITAALKKVAWAIVNDSEKTVKIKENVEEDSADIDDPQAYVGLKAKEDETDEAQKFAMPDKDQQERALNLLKKILSTRKLPTNTGERWFSIGEFMLMPSPNPKIYAFKHKQSREYLYINADSGNPFGLEKARFGESIEESSDYYILVVHNKRDGKDKGWDVIHSAHKEPNLGGQVLKGGMKENDAKAFAKKMATKGEKILHFELTGDWPNVDWKPIAESMFDNTFISEVSPAVLSNAWKSVDSMRGREYKMSDDGMLMTIEKQMPELAGMVKAMKDAEKNPEAFKKAAEALYKKLDDKVHGRSGEEKPNEITDYSKFVKDVASLIKIGMASDKAKKLGFTLKRIEQVAPFGPTDFTLVGDASTSEKAIPIRAELDFKKDGPNQLLILRSTVKNKTEREDFKGSTLKPVTVAKFILHQAYRANGDVTEDVDKWLHEALIQYGFGDIIQCRKIFGNGAVRYRETLKPPYLVRVKKTNEHMQGEYSGFEGILLDKDKKDMAGGDVWGLTVDVIKVVFESTNENIDEAAEQKKIGPYSDYSAAHEKGMKLKNQGMKSIQIKKGEGGKWFIHYVEYVKENTDEAANTAFLDAIGVNGPVKRDDTFGDLVNWTSHAMQQGGETDRAAVRPVGSRNYWLGRSNARMIDYKKPLSFYLIPVLTEHGWKLNGAVWSHPKSSVQIAQVRSSDEMKRLGSNEFSLKYVPVRNEDGTMPSGGNIDPSIAGATAAYTSKVKQDTKVECVDGTFDMIYRGETAVINEFQRDCVILKIEGLPLAKVPISALKQILDFADNPVTGEAIVLPADPNDIEEHLKTGKEVAKAFESKFNSRMKLTVFEPTKVSATGHGATAMYSSATYPGMSIWVDSDVNPNGVTGKDDIKRTYVVHTKAGFGTENRRYAFYAYSVDTFDGVFKKFDEWLKKLEQDEKKLKDQLEYWTSPETIKILPSAKGGEVKRAMTKDHAPAFELTTLPALGVKYVAGLPKTKAAKARLVKLTNGSWGFELSEDVNEDTDPDDDPDGRHTDHDENLTLHYNEESVSEDQPFDHDGSLRLLRSIDAETLEDSPEIICRNEEIFLEYIEGGSMVVSTEGGTKLFKVPMSVLEDSSFATHTFENWQNEYKRVAKELPSALAAAGLKVIKFENLEKNGHFKALVSLSGPSGSGSEAEKFIADLYIAPPEFQQLRSASGPAKNKGIGLNRIKVWPESLGTSATVKYDRIIIMYGAVQSAWERYSRGSIKNDRQSGPWQDFFKAVDTTLRNKIGEISIGELVPISKVGRSNENIDEAAEPEYTYDKNEREKLESNLKQELTKRGFKYDERFTVYHWTNGKINIRVGNLKPPYSGAPVTKDRKTWELNVEVSKGSGQGGVAIAIQLFKSQKIAGVPDMTKKALAFVDHHQKTNEEKLPESGGSLSGLTIASGIKGKNITKGSTLVMVGGDKEEVESASMDGDNIIIKTDKGEHKIGTKDSETKIEKYLKPGVEEAALGRTNIHWKSNNGKAEIESAYRTDNSGDVEYTVKALGEVIKVMASSNGLITTKNISHKPDTKSTWEATKAVKEYRKFIGEGSSDDCLTEIEGTLSGTTIINGIKEKNITKGTTVFIKGGGKKTVVSAEVNGDEAVIKTEDDKEHKINKDSKESEIEKYLKPGIKEGAAGEKFIKVKDIPSDDLRKAARKLLKARKPNEKVVYEIEDDGGKVARVNQSEFETIYLHNKGYDEWRTVVEDINEVDGTLSGTTVINGIKEKNITKGTTLFIKGSGKKTVASAEVNGDEAIIKTEDGKEYKVKKDEKESQIEKYLKPGVKEDDDLGSATVHEADDETYAMSERVLKKLVDSMVNIFEGIAKKVTDNDNTLVNKAADSFKKGLESEGKNRLLKPDFKNFDALIKEIEKFVKETMEEGGKHLALAQGPKSAFGNPFIEKFRKEFQANNSPDEIHKFAEETAKMMDERSPKVKFSKTFAQAQKEIFDYLKSRGWTINTNLKIPHATSPRKDIRLWFKAQAVYGDYASSEKELPTSIQQVHSLPFSDIRGLDGKMFVKILKRWFKDADIKESDEPENTQLPSDSELKSVGEGVKNLLKEMGMSLDEAAAKQVSNFAEKCKGFFGKYGFETESVKENGSALSIVGKSRTGKFSATINQDKVSELKFVTPENYQITYKNGEWEDDVPLTENDKFESDKKDLGRFVAIANKKIKEFKAEVREGLEYDEKTANEVMDEWAEAITEEEWAYRVEQDNDKEVDRYFAQIQGKADPNTTKPVLAWLLGNKLDAHAKRLIDAIKEGKLKEFDIHPNVLRGKAVRTKYSKTPVTWKEVDWHLKNWHKKNEDGVNEAATVKDLQNIMFMNSFIGHVVGYAEDKKLAIPNDGKSLIEFLKKCFKESNSELLKSFRGKKGDDALKGLTPRELEMLETDLKKEVKKRERSPEDKQKWADAFARGKGDVDESWIITLKNINKANEIDDRFRAFKVRSVVKDGTVKVIDKIPAEKLKKILSEILPGQSNSLFSYVKEILPENIDEIQGKPKEIEVSPRAKVAWTEAHRQIKKLVDDLKKAEDEKSVKSAINHVDLPDPVFHSSKRIVDIFDRFIDIMWAAGKSWQKHKNDILKKLAEIEKGFAQLADEPPPLGESSDKFFYNVPVVHGAPVGPGKEGNLEEELEIPDPKGVDKDKWEKEAKQKIKDNIEVLSKKLKVVKFNPDKPLHNYVTLKYPYPIGMKFDLGVTTLFGYNPSQIQTVLSRLSDIVELYIDGKDDQTFRSNWTSHVQLKFKSSNVLRSWAQYILPSAWHYAGVSESIPDEEISISDEEISVLGPAHQPPNVTFSEGQTIDPSVLGKFQVTFQHDIPGIKDWWFRVDDLTKDGFPDNGAVATKAISGQVFSWKRLSNGVVKFDRNDYTRYVPEDVDLFVKKLTRSKGMKPLDEKIRESINEAWMDWQKYDNQPVQIVGVKNGEITGLNDQQVFPNLDAAKKVFPDLDPQKNTKRFTWAMRGEVNRKPAIRFETWTVEKILSQ